MKTRFWKAVFYFVIPVFLIQVIGCGTTKSVYRKVTGGNSGLKKKIMVLPVIDQPRLGEARAAQVTERLISLLKQDGGLLVQKGMKFTPSAQKMRSPEFGMGIDPDLAKRAEELGMNVLIMAVLTPFEEDTRKSGWWPFRSIKRELKISLLVNAIDVVNGTLLLTSLETRRVEVSQNAEQGEEDKKKIDDHELEEALSRILERQAAAISSGLRESPWFGRVISTDQKTVTINAGRDIGLTPGRVFDVFSRGEPIQTASGRSLFPLGPKVGEIKTVDIMDSYASAVPLNGGHFRAGQVIKIKN